MTRISSTHHSACDSDLQSKLYFFCQQTEPLQQRNASQPYLTHEHNTMVNKPHRIANQPHEHPPSNKHCLPSPPNPVSTPSRKKQKTNSANSVSEPQEQKIPKQSSREREKRTNQKNPPKKDHINKSTLEIKPQDNNNNNQIYPKIQLLQDDLPDNTPRYILLSYPLTLSSGRLSVPYVMLNYLPPTCSSEMRMLYAGAKELMKNTAEAGKIIEIENAEDLEGIEEILKT
ncbi:hypothetical protein AC579_1874 [Pseudocercospora musae]|uniref:ADF-H domain-containing protein n=1 Tax=Pseudocercospora musae TaxID=113226 RepID=A0A139IBE8_9PEZI|nr:hypothetical protein AC579_1874 [Pseudocercospora musae]